MSAAGWLDMNAALENLRSPPESQSPQKPRRKRRSSYAGRSASTAGVHGRGSIGTISSGIFKSFRERFLSSSSGESANYRKLRQRDAETGRIGENASSSSESSGEDEEPSSSSSVEDLFANEAERRKWQRKTSDQIEGTEPILDRILPEYRFIGIGIGIRGGSVDGSDFQLLCLMVGCTQGLIFARNGG